MAEGTYLQWQGRTEQAEDLVTVAGAQALGAILGRDADTAWPGAELPPLWHWTLFKPTVPQASLGPDGHPSRGGFLPPIELERRMWAGSRIQFHQPLRVGMAIERKSTIRDVREKIGRAGALIFVRVGHDIFHAGQLAISEEQDIVYRDQPKSGQGIADGSPARTPEDFGRKVRPDPVLLFRYSAVTFNAHRIHYDRDYAREAEHYPGLVVHGPLIATLLVDLLRKELGSVELRRFEFKAVRPLFDTNPFRISAHRVSTHEWSLWATDPDGFVAMEAIAETNQQS